MIFIKQHFYLFYNMFLMEFLLNMIDTVSNAIKKGAIAPF